MPKRTQKYTKKNKKTPNKKTPNKKRPIKHRKTAKQHKRRKSYKQRGGRVTASSLNMYFNRLALAKTKKEIKEIIHEIPRHEIPRHDITEHLRQTTLNQLETLTDPLREDEIRDLFRGWGFPEPSSPR